MEHRPQFSDQLVYLKARGWFSHAHYEAPPGVKACRARADPSSFSHPGRLYILGITHSKAVVASTYVQHSVITPWFRLMLNYMIVYFSLLDLGECNEERLLQLKLKEATDVTTVIQRKILQTWI